MTWVKVCGLTNRPDVDISVEAGADAVGVVVEADSPRSVDLRVAGELIAGLEVSTVMVTVDVPADRLMAFAAETGFTGIQPHGRHASDAANAGIAAGLLVLFPVAVGSERPDLSSIPDSAVPLLDTADPKRHGGTGRSFDWTLATDSGRRIVLAGGLTPTTVAGAVAAAHPWGVDVATGVERSPGVKDHDAVRSFVREAKR
ncbi:MAG TPA: phosphoribosylanthranilate isomerase [Acidimicrobiia bacterium]|nr:phosphoribosylanthranilate isomerase [Acidimicrobiia bacterium]